MVQKRPAAADPGPVPLKKPASWQAYAKDEGEKPPDEAPTPEDDVDFQITPQQRHVWKKAWPTLPEDVKKAYMEAKNSRELGACKRANAIINSVVDKDCAYKDTVTIDARTFERFRKVVRKTTKSEGCVGYTKTQMIGSGMLGSLQALQGTRFCVLAKI